jgi:hypothetical protein
MLPCHQTMVTLTNLDFKAPDARFDRALRYHLTVASETIAGTAIGLISKTRWRTMGKHE